MNGAGSCVRGPSGTGCALCDVLTVHDVHSCELVRRQERAAALQDGLNALACAAADGGLEAVVTALLERRCAGVNQAEAGEAAERVLLDEVLAAAAAAAPHLLQQLLWPLRAILQCQARARQSRLSGPACSACVVTG